VLVLVKVVVVVVVLLLLLLTVVLMVIMYLNLALLHVGVLLVVLVLMLVVVLLEVVPRHVSGRSHVLQEVTFSTTGRRRRAGRIIFLDARQRLLQFSIHRRHSLPASRRPGTVVHTPVFQLGRVVLHSLLDGGARLVQPEPVLHIVHVPQLTAAVPRRPVLVLDETTCGRGQLKEKV